MAATDAFTASSHALSALLKMNRQRRASTALRELAEFVDVARDLSPNKTLGGCVIMIGGI